ncbi:MAG: hypothetical protein KGN34_05120 [Sphingomonadales bacterium]|nr:hypothetical protein [Sphingomonadales bacterium]
MATADWNPETLRDWLSDKPRSWAIAIAAREALRVLPLALSEPLISERSLATEVGVALRGAFVAWCAASFQDSRIYGNATVAADRAAREFENKARAGLVLRVTSAVNVARCAVDAVVSEKSNYAAMNAAVACNGSGVYTWDEVQRDTFELVNRGYDALLERPLWSSGDGNAVTSVWREVKATLLMFHPSFAVWTDWYDRRLRGERLGFAVTNGVADEQVHLQMLSLRDGQWELLQMREDAAQLNSQIQWWIDAALRVPSEAEFSQNPLVPQFDESANGQMGPAVQHLAIAGPDHDGFVRRHQLTRQTLCRAIEASASGLTQATGIGDTLGEAINALGHTPEEMQPESYVVYSKALRREIKDHLSPESFKPPLSEKQLEKLEVWIDADAIMLALHDGLAASEKAVYERRFGPVTAERDNIVALIDGIRHSGLPTREADRLLGASIAAVPLGAGPDNPELRTAEQVAENFVRRTGRKVWTGVQASGRFVKGAWGPGGKFLAWVVNHQATLIEQYPALAPVIRFIAKWVD